MLKFITLLISLHLLHLVHLYMVKLPECEYSADFNIQNQRYFEGKVNETLLGISQSDCALSCLTLYECVFVNYKPSEMLCEMLNSLHGTLRSDADWTFLSTDYTAFMVGSVCKRLQLCPPNSYCIDVCKPPLYKCFSANIAPTGIATQSSTSYIPAYAVDSNENTMAATLGEISSWWKLDLLKVYRIVQIIIWNKTTGTAGCTISTSVDSADSSYTFCGLGENYFETVLSCKITCRYVMIGKCPNIGLAVSEVIVIASAANFVPYVTVSDDAV